MNRQSRPAAMSCEVIDEVCHKLQKGQAVRRLLKPYGRIHIDRLQPFLFIHRRPPQATDDLAASLVTGEASYIVASGDPGAHDDLAKLVRRLADLMAGAFESALVVELWEAPDSGGDGDGDCPDFRLIISGDRLSTTVETLLRALSQVTIQNQAPSLAVSAASTVSPPGMAALLPVGKAPDSPGPELLGVEVLPAYRDPRSRKTYPLIHRSLQRSLSRAMRQAIFQFALDCTTYRPMHYQALGRRRVVKAVWEVDRQLSAVSNRFDLILLVSPTNVHAAWKEFDGGGFSEEPRFLYRPRPVDPALCKRDLYRIPIEKIEDPTLAYLFRAQQANIDRRLTMLAERGTGRFLYESLQVYGGVEPELLALAEAILHRFPPRTTEGKVADPVDAGTLAKRAEEEIAFYQERYPELSSKVNVRQDIAGLLVSRGNLLIGARTSVPAARVGALLQHEVGTHILTHFNGKAQPFRQLYAGLPGYEEVQEGLAVMAEYLAGGLTPRRLRLLAGRALAVRMLAAGASFIDVFRALTDRHGFDHRRAFGITCRVFRGGGLTKDAVYLRGLSRLLRYFQGGGSIEPLLVGKVGLDHVPMVEELLWRQVLVPAPLMPRYLQDRDAVEKLDRLKGGMTVFDLTERRAT